MSAQPSHGDGARLLTAEEVAARWQVKAAHVYRLARENRVPVVRLGRYYRFRLQALEQFESAGGVYAKSDMSAP